MTDKIIRLPENVKKAIDMLYAGGFSAYAVGGCVRDSLMGRTPMDWDITTSALPEDTKRIFADFRTVDTGIRHGTVTVLMGGEGLEITTYRREGCYSDHRHPDEVSFTPDITEDLKRRDFTVNAMAFNHIEGFVDLFGGCRDIERQVIRCVGDAEQRFREDALRMLRGLRFAATLGFDLEPATAEAMLKLKDDLNFVAPERIAEEFRKFISGSRAPHILREYSRLFCVFIPELAPMINCEQISRYHIYDVWEHTLKALEHCTELSHDTETRLAVLFHDIGKPRAKSYDPKKQVNHFYGHAPISAGMCADILSRLRFDNRTKENVMWLIRHHDEKIPLKELRIKRILAAAGEDMFIKLLHLMECDNAAKTPAVAEERKDHTARCLGILQKLKDEDACLSLKNLEISGNELLDLGAKPGKVIGTVLSELLDLVMTGQLKNESAALRARAKKLLAMYPEDGSK